MQKEIRLLAAIMFSDIVGYTAMMQYDEQDGNKKRKRYRTVLENLTTKHQGKIVQYYGDGALSIFGSVVEAVRCAVEIQNELLKEPKVSLRIGLHTGDIVYNDDGAYGDGVNVASRVENLSVPGGVLISEKVYDEIINHPEFSTVSIGKFELKNVKHPVNLYAISNEGLSIPPLEEEKSTKAQKTISHYKIINKIGEGGMGVVYLAEDTKLKRKVALKFLSPHFTMDEQAKVRFIHEAQTASALQHENICTIHEINETDEMLKSPVNQLYICMDYYVGETLRDRLEKGPMEKNEAIDLIIQVAEGLSAAHNKGIIHRDIKPANIFITNEGIVKILDFGLAKSVSIDTITRIGKTMGTIAYMSPEQTKGENVDYRTDIWSLAVMLYEMLSGKLPFTGEYEQAILYSIINEDPEPLKNIPDELNKIITKCMAKEPDNRYSLDSELLNNLVEVRYGDQAEGNYRKRKSLFKQVRSKKIFHRSILQIGIAFVLLIVVLLYLNKEKINIWSVFISLPVEKHLVVIPFTNVANSPTVQVQINGLVEIITTRLTLLEEFQGTLSVVPATEVRSDDIKSVREARKKYDVNLAVTGSIQVKEEDVTATINLIDAESLKQLFSRLIKCSISTIHKLEYEIPIKITKMLKLEMKPEQLEILKAEILVSDTASNNYILGRGYLLEYQKLENIDAAIAAFKRALKEEPNYAVAYAGLGEAYLKKYNLTDDNNWVTLAIENCDKALELNDQLAPVMVTRGLIYHETGRYMEAAEEFNKAIIISPLNGDAYLNLALTYRSLNELTKAEDTYKKAIQVRPKYWGGYNRLGSFYYHHGRYEKAVEQFSKVIELTPNNTKGYANLGAVYFALDRWEDAAEVFERSLVIEPSYGTYYNLGTLYFYQQRFDKAAQMYKSALEFNDKDYEVWAVLGESYYWTPGQEELVNESYYKAIILAEKQLEVNPNNQKILADLASYNARLGNRVKAHEWLNRIIELGTADLQIQFRIGEAYEYLGERETALKWFERILEKGFSSVTFYNHLSFKDLLTDERFKKLMKKYSENTTSVEK
jgi:serine/threonine-protein kinase